MKERKKILVVDDDQDCLDFAQEILTKEGYEVFTALDGSEGCDKAKSVCPDMIILDVMMPKQDGWDTCDKLRDTPEGRTIPIVYLTCVDLPKSHYVSHIVFDTDWDEYLTKPVAPEELISVVSRLLQRVALVS